MANRGLCTQRRPVVQQAVAPVVDGPGSGRLRQDELMAECVFCAIVAGDAPAEIVHRDDVAVAFLDRTPLFPGHVLVVPTEHVVTLPELIDVGPYFERVQLLSRAVPVAMDAQGSFV